MLQKFLAKVFDDQHEFEDIWELKLIKFDIDLDQNIKHYEKYLAISSMVEDVKGNPGFKGDFFLTNLRLIWHAKNDKNLNLSIGLDTISNLILKTQPAQSGFNDMKYILTVKSLSPSQTKYEFKFAGHSQSEQKIFKRIIEVHKKFNQTKWFRNIDTNVKLINNEYKPLEGEEFKTRYEKCSFYQNEIQKDVTIILTNTRLVVVYQKSSSVNYGIPWIMIQSYTKTDHQSRDAIQLKIRGLLKDVQILITCPTKSDFNKMHQEMLSFSETYNKNPMLGMNFSILERKEEEVQKAKLEIKEIEQTKVNIGRRKNAYGDQNQRGALKNTFFNEELGIMMERFPEGATRMDFWEILRT